MGGEGGWRGGQGRRAHLGKAWLPLRHVSRHRLPRGLAPLLSSPPLTPLLRAEREKQRARCCRLLLPLLPPPPLPPSILLVTPRHFPPIEFRQLIFPRPCGELSSQRSQPSRLPLLRIFPLASLLGKKGRRGGVERGERSSGVSPPHASPQPAAGGGEESQGFSQLAHPLPYTGGEGGGRGGEQ